MVKHKHHIVPKHMGGTDDPSNLVELTVEEHAEAHRKLYEEHGRKEDLCAWKGLSGQWTRLQVHNYLRTVVQARVELPQQIVQVRTVALSISYL